MAHLGNFLSLVRLNFGNTDLGSGIIVGRWKRLHLNIMLTEFFSQNIWWFVAWVIVLNLLLLSIMQNAVKGANTVSALELPQLQRDGKSVIIDVNENKDFSVRHLPDAINIPLANLNNTNNELMKHKDATTIVVCETGSRSNKAAKQLLSLGFTDVNILRGGILSWTKENLPVVRG